MKPYSTNTVEFKPVAGARTTTELVEHLAILWRITCFFVDKQYRRKGVSSFGLDEMLKKIKPREEELLSHTLSPISELSVCGLASFPCTRTEASRQLHNLDEVHIW